jgi:hypothetical protein
MRKREPSPPDTPLLLLTREQVAQRCQVSLRIVNEWTWQEGFPVIRRRGGHFVRIHAHKLDE